MNRTYSYRDIENECRRDINFMFLLEGHQLQIMQHLKDLEEYILPTVLKKF